MADVLSLAFGGLAQHIVRNSLQRAFTVAVPVVEQIVSQATVQAGGANSGGGWWPWRGSDNNASGNFHLFVAVGVVWVLSMLVVSCCSCLAGCGVALALRSSIGRVGEAMWNAAAGAGQFYGLNGLARRHNPLPPDSLNKLEALFATASFIEGGGEEAVNHTAAELGIHRSQVQSWYAKWQVAKEGPKGGRRPNF